MLKKILQHRLCFEIAEVLQKEGHQEFLDVHFQNRLHQEEPEKLAQAVSRLQNPRKFPRIESSVDQGLNQDLQKDHHQEDE